MYRTLLMMAFVVLSGFAMAQTPVAGTPAAAKIEWLTWDQAVAKMEKEPRKIMVDVYTDWCGWCKRMDASTFQDP